ncbi:MAG: membrane dipeptidase, partial [Bacillota bacterium]|nr:membrane dipeptidase [Bacillota bacterium]
MSLLVPGSFPLRGDSHCDTVVAEKNGDRIHIDFETIELYCDLQFFALYLEAEGDTAAAVEENRLAYKYYNTLLNKYESKLIPILTSDDLKGIGGGKVGSLLAMENSEPLAEDSEALYRLYEKGYRSFGITWSNENSLGGGVNTEVGLTDLGKDVLRAMNSLNVLVDLAHMNEKTFFDTMVLVENPPIVTHACCRKLCDHRRNLTDDQLKCLGEAKGMMGITFARSFLDHDTGNRSIDRIVDHVIYAAEIVGID